MEENSALAGVMSSVETLSRVLRETGTSSTCSGTSGTGRNLMLGPRVISTFSASSGGSGGMSKESSTM